jgi:hypothetical protein
MSFLIGDSQKNSHLAFTKTGAKVFIVDWFDIVETNRNISHNPFFAKYLYSNS